MVVGSEGVRLAPYTTLRLGGPAGRFVEVAAEAELVAAVAHADREGEPVLVLGGGSNVVVSDAGFPGTVVRVASRGVEFGRDGDRVLVTAQAGEDWDALVSRCVEEGLSGLECLSGIPGLVGATPVQNVGAYGQEIAQTVASVRVFDRRSGEIIIMSGTECGFSYRHSIFKADKDRYVVLAVGYSLTRSAESGPLRYQELATLLGVAADDRVPLGAARSAVLSLRRGKGMVLDETDPDTRSVGSFFTNPVLTPPQAAELELRAPGFPRWPAGEGVKVPAAWLIEQAGYPKGYSRGRARISGKHPLALTNPHGEATAAELLELAREVRDGVAEKFGVRLINEPVLIGMEL
ncbi:UDP-N-acetylmuramate dehydrogenase [Rhizohabitans arisaemae]|uniref:UDP-N-acetylmuramate dehydrogenase n=1 Tax=Rhizohabitans arisaemae TaxID=2720610 RepID=UPI0024B121E2|nr:UDP-N-acetylmuramate dehydrogenase [Rhizohabitans arisaemae]